MVRKIIRYAFVLCIAYIIVVGYLGFFVRDDFFALTFPSWPFLINCFENCGYKMLIALFANGILVWALSFVVIRIAFFTFKFTSKLGRSFVERKLTKKHKTVKRKKNLHMQKKRLYLHKSYNRGRIVTLDNTEIHNLTNYNVIE
jgi:hypothetical protein